LKPRLAITCGDPSGIGPEVVAAWLSAGGDAGQTIIGPSAWLDTLPGGGPRVGVGVPGFTAEPGRPTGEGALVAWAALERAAELCARGECDGAVTGPVSKEGMAAIGWGFPGQTEFFAARWKGEPTMAFCGGRLRVALVTWHIPLRDVPGSVTEAGLSRTVRAADELARSDGIAAPRIGVCGLNPHAGEGGLLGTEERDLIDPVLDRLRRGYPGLSRCQPADTLFARQLKGEFDVLVALYHDQALAPLKAVDFEEAVNATLGLAHVRTSPDHGTAFGIAGRSMASPRSFSNAVIAAERLIRARQ
jgi:4-hydroxythreonine-4-phosphate dehydrogenase